MMTSPLRKIRRFTLIELLVAMGVFVILVALMLQFFSGAQKLWASSESRNQVYADGRAAMELMNELLFSTTFLLEESTATAAGYSQNGFFRLSNNSSGRSAIYFTTKTPLPLPMDTDPVRFVGFSRGHDGTASDPENYKLYLTSFCDCSTCNTNDDKASEHAFPGLFPPYGVTTGIDNRGQVRDYLTEGTGKLIPANAVHKTLIAERVTAFEISAVKSNGTAVAAASDTSSAAGESDITLPPVLLNIRLAMIDTADNFNTWRQMSDGAAKDKFRAAHERVFSRAVYLGDRWALEKQ